MKLHPRETNQLSKVRHKLEPTSVVDQIPEPTTFFTQEDAPPTLDMKKTLSRGPNLDEGCQGVLPLVGFVTFRILKPCAFLDF